MCLFKKWKQRREQLRIEKQQQEHVENVDSSSNQRLNEDQKSIEPSHLETKAQKNSTSQAPTKPTEKAYKYHVSQNKDDKSPQFKKWRVRKEGSTKTIQYFDTQKEAIDYAQELADKAGSSMVIHKVDGSIRKQDYSKK
jgi:hypothetical protein